MRWWVFANPTVIIIHDLCKSNHYAVHFKLKKYRISICCCYCLVAESCQTFWDPIGCISPGPSVHGIFQVRTLEWVAISFSRGSFQTMDQTLVFHITCTAHRFFPAEPPGKYVNYISIKLEEKIQWINKIFSLLFPFKNNKNNSQTRGLRTS